MNANQPLDKNDIISEKIALVLRPADPYQCVWVKFALAQCADKLTY